jgi:uncharacterized protein (TIGR01244 family)
MANLKLNDLMTIGGQPTAEDLKKLREQGFKTIVNFRTAGEDEQPMSPADEGKAVASLGLKYLHLPVWKFKPEDVDQFRHELTNLPTPVFAHCKSGTRAGIMALLNMAVDREWSGDKAIEKGNEMGLKLDKAEHVDFVKKYADDHITKS